MGITNLTIVDQQIQPLQQQHTPTKQKTSSETPDKQTTTPKFNNNQKRLKPSPAHATTPQKQNQKRSKQSDEHISSPVSTTRLTFDIDQTDHFSFNPARGLNFNFLSSSLPMVSTPEASYQQLKHECNILQNKYSELQNRYNDLKKHISELQKQNSELLFQQSNLKNENMKLGGSITTLSNDIMWKKFELDDLKARHEDTILIINQKNSQNIDTIKIEHGKDIAALNQKIADTNSNTDQEIRLLTTQLHELNEKHKHFRTVSLKEGVERRVHIRIQLGQFLVDLSGNEILA
jgi:vacuolar-type H+-ATPase subunit I/STV1